MKTVKFNVENEIVIKNSRFIALLYRLKSEDDFLDIMRDVKRNYPKATHYTYAYLLPDRQKSSDDGEPGGTAGLPILNVLIKEGLINVLAVVVRYFGGEKLGAGGLVRAYTKSVTEALEKAGTTKLLEGYLVEVKAPYDKQKNLDYLFKNYQVISKDFSLDITYSVLIPKEDISILSNYSYQIIEEKYIENAF